MCSFMVRESTEKKIDGDYRVRQILDHSLASLLFTLTGCITIDVTHVKRLCVLLVHADRVHQIFRRRCKK